MQEYAENDSAAQDLKSLVGLVDSHGAEMIISAVDRLSPEENAQVTVFTAHKAKGREWASVRVGAGFVAPSADDNGIQRRISLAEAGYLLLDYDDGFGISRVGPYLSRQGAGITWDVSRFLELLGADEPLPELRGKLRTHRPSGDLILDMRNLAGKIAVRGRRGDLHAAAVVVGEE